MAYQNVGTPRFYVNVLEYLHSIGHINIAPKLMTLPVLPEPDGQDATLDVANTMSGGKNFIAMLNTPHNSSFSIDEVTDGNAVDVINMYGEHNGFKIATFSEDIATVSVNGIAGSIIIGNYYDMPHSPDLSIKISYEYDGVKNITTKGGATLSNASYVKPANWGYAGAWQLSSTLADGTQSHVPSNFRSGRRVFDLNFSFLSDTDVFPVNANTSYAAALQDQDAAGYASGDLNANEDEFTSNILDGTDFFSQVWNKTMGGYLPFIFNPQGGGTSPDNNPQNFAICRFDMKSLQYDQVANNVYNVKLKIRESL